MINKLAKGTAKGLVAPMHPIDTTKDLAKFAVKNAEKALDTIVGLDEKTKRGIQDNPKIKSEWKKANQLINEKGIPEKPQDISKHLLQEVQQSLQKEITSHLDQFAETGPLYKKLKESGAKVDLTSAKNSITDILIKEGVEVNSKGKLSFDFTSLSEAEGKAIQRVYDWVEKKPNMDVSEYMRFRKSIDELGMRENKKGSPGQRVLKEIRAEANKMAHKQNPAFGEVDALYSAQKKALDTFTEGLVYRDKRKFGEWRDNMNQILKNLDTPNRKRLADRLDNLLPGVEQQVAAINLMPKLITQYYGKVNTPMQKFTNSASRLATAFVGAKAGASFAGAYGAIGGAILGYFGKQGYDKVKASRWNKVLSTMSEEGISNLQKIEEKIANNQKLSQKQAMEMEKLAKKLSGGGLGNAEPTASPKQKTMNESIHDSSMVARIDGLAGKHNVEGGNALSKMKRLNKLIAKGKGYQESFEKEIYKLKEEIILDHVVSKGKVIKDRGSNTTVRIRQGNSSVNRHLTKGVRKELKSLGLLK